MAKACQLRLVPRKSGLWSEFTAVMLCCPSMAVSRGSPSANGRLDFGHHGSVIKFQISLLKFQISLLSGSLGLLSSVRRG